MSVIHARVALIEAEEDIRKLLAKALLRHGYQVSTFASAEEFLGSDGLARLLEFDVVVLDYQMVEMNGQELCQRIKAVRPELPVIIESGMPGREFIGECLKAGANRVLTKPFSVEELLATIHAVLPTVDIKKITAPSVSDVIEEAVASAVLDVVEEAIGLADDDD
ncbi:MAG: response regulator [Candidatus Paceibacterota bacterium]|jgi:DNA-binding response OmpR family regulator